MQATAWKGAQGGGEGFSPRPAMMSLRQTRFLTLPGGEPRTVLGKSPSYSLLPGEVSNIRADGIRSHQLLRLRPTRRPSTPIPSKSSKSMIPEPCLLLTTLTGHKLLSGCSSCIAGCTNATSIQCLHKRHWTMLACCLRRRTVTELVCLPTPSLLLRGVRRKILASR
jgi:hypothetical protein